MKIARDVKIVAVEAECSCGGPLIAENGSFSLPVYEAEFRCQDCGAKHRLPLWISARNGRTKQAA